MKKIQYIIYNDLSIISIYYSFNLDLNLSQCIFGNQHKKVCYQVNIFHNLNDIFELHRLLNE